ncbi:MAG: SulP family inorganic anion transporter [Gammaproteobacteria bacterium]|nr:SulP family inorganic anion transporter [Gammaproteobacteria bacterium]
MPGWLRNYRRALLPGDIGAGIIVALLMVPQGMAYAIVAGLPPIAGLYASILPPLAYALFGTSMTQSVGPQAITALLVAGVLAPLALPASPEYVLLAARLALLTGLILFACGLLRLGFLVNYLSQPVMSGFTNGAVLLIAAGQVPSLLGLNAGQVQPASAATGLGCILLLILARKHLDAGLCRLGISRPLAEALARTAPILVLLGTALLLALPGPADLGIPLVGEVPTGLPPIGIHLAGGPWRELFVPALLLGFIVFLQSMSAAQALARKRHERLVADRELLGLGAANLAGALSGGFPVAGSISRSAISHEAGANTPLASMVASLLLAALLVSPTGWLAMLPLPALAATIIVAVTGMFEWSSVRDAWRYDRSEAAAHIVTLVAVVSLGAERGIVLGIVLSLALLIWRASHPPIVEVGRRPGGEYFRSAERQNVERLPRVLMLRIDQGLFFGNAAAVTDHVEQALRRRPELQHIVLLLSAVNDIDLTAAQALIGLNRTLGLQGVKLHLTEAKAPVLDRLGRTPLLQELGGQVFHRAVQAFDYLATGGD